MIQNKLTNMSLFVDGRGYLGMAEEVTPPKIAMQTDDYMAGGMPGPIKVSKGVIDALEAEFTLKGYSSDILKLFNVEPCRYVPFVFRGALSDCEAGTRAIVLSMRGQIQEIDMGNWKPSDKGETKYTASLSYYKLEIDGRAIYEIDPVNCVRIINGTDELAAERAAIGRAGCNQRRRAVAHGGHHFARGPGQFHRAARAGVMGQVPHGAVAAGQEHGVKVGAVELGHGPRVRQRLLGLGIVQKALHQGGRLPIGWHAAGVQRGRAALGRGQGDAAASLRKCLPGHGQLFQPDAGGLAAVAQLAVRGDDDQDVARGCHGRTPG